MKKCSKCKIDKGLDEFHKNKAQKDGLCNQCKACSSLESRRRSQSEWRKRNLPKVRELHLLARYNITNSDYDKLLESQGGVCAICGTDDPKSPQGSIYFNIDHDHSTGEVRGLLCTPCNQGLGFFGDSIDQLEKAIEYLMKHTDIADKQLSLW